MDIFLSKNTFDFCKELSETTLNVIDKLTLKKHFKKLDIITKPGDKGNVYIIVKGRVKVYELNNRNKFIHSILGKGEIFGDFGFDISSHVYIEAIDNAEVHIVKTKQFIDIINQDSKLLLKIFEHFYIKLLITQEKVIFNAHNTISTRLIKLLVQLSKPINTFSTEYITEKFTHNELSQMLGVSRQTITMTINNLKRNGLLKNKKKSFIFDKEQLVKKTNISFNKLDTIKLRLNQMPKS